MRALRVRKEISNTIIKLRRCQVIAILDAGSLRVISVLYESRAVTLGFLIIMLGETHSILLLCVRVLTFPRIEFKVLSHHPDQGKPLGVLLHNRSFGNTSRGSRRKQDVIWSGSRTRSSPPTSPLGVILDPMSGSWGHRTTT